MVGVNPYAFIVDSGACSPTQTDNTMLQILRRIGKGNNILQRDTVPGASGISTFCSTSAPSDCGETVGIDFTLYQMLCQNGVSGAVTNATRERNIYHLF